MKTQVIQENIDPATGKDYSIFGWNNENVVRYGGGSADGDSAVNPVDPTPGPPVDPEPEPEPKPDPEPSPDPEPEPTPIQSQAQTQNQVQTQTRTKPDRIRIRTAIRTRVDSTRM